VKEESPPQRVCSPFRDSTLSRSKFSPQFIFRAFNLCSSLRTTDQIRFHVREAEKNVDVIHWCKISSDLSECEVKYLWYITAGNILTFQVHR
jgi:hypothetical protein